jgi:hypothetical protein
MVDAAAPCSSSSSAPARGYRLVPYEAPAATATMAVYCYRDTCRAELFNHLFWATRPAHAGRVACAACAVHEPMSLHGPRGQPVSRRYAITDLRAWLADFEAFYFGSASAA